MKQRRYQYIKSLAVIACMAFILTIGVNLTKGGQGDISGIETSPDVFTFDMLGGGDRLETKRFDKSLHDLHTEITGKECGTCHHVKGKETSCRKCHKETDRKKIISMKNASHISCIGCHREMSGPVNCSDCHTRSGEEETAKSGEFPIPIQAKPEIMKEREKDLDKHRGTPVHKMSPVHFDHEIHREYLDKCDIPLRSGSGSCAECHTADGSKQGQMLTAEHAMHEIENKKSCVGCHEDKKKDKECAGCHRVMRKGENFNAICLKCHMEPSKHKGGKALMNKSEDIQDRDIADVVIIDKLSARYGAVELPHRRIIDSLLLGINKSKLATHFHNGKETICLGCHHYSPPGKALGCDACHNSLSDGQDLSRPGLNIAYHQQCIGCHDFMGIESPGSTGCVDCHKVIEGKTE